MLITTVVSVDTQHTGDELVINLVQGDYGTRRLMFIPSSGGAPVSLSGVTSVKLQASSTNTGILLLDCVLESGSIYFTPTAALVANADEFACQLVMLDSNQQTLHSFPFSIVVHGDVFNGDTVEHTNTTVASAWFNENANLYIRLADGTTIDGGTHTHPAATSSAAGFMSAAQVTALNTLTGYVDQDLKTTASPTFNAITISGVTIDEDGYCTGLKFT